MYKKYVIISSENYDNMHIHKVVSEHEEYVKVERDPVCNGEIRVSSESFDEPSKALNRETVRSISKLIQDECDQGKRDKGICANCIKHFYI